MIKVINMYRFSHKFLLLNLIFFNTNVLVALASTRDQAGTGADGSGSDMEVGYERSSAPVLVAPLHRSSRVVISAAAAGATRVLGWDSAVSVAEQRERAHYEIQESRRAIPRGRVVPDVRIYISNSQDPQETVDCEFSISQYTGNPDHLYTAYARFVRRAQQLQNRADAAVIPGRTSPSDTDIMTLLSGLPAPVYRASSPVTSASASVAESAAAGAPALERSFSTATIVRPPSPDWAAGAAVLVSSRRRRVAISAADRESKTREARAGAAKRARLGIKDYHGQKIHAPGFDDYSSGEDSLPRVSS